METSWSGGVDMADATWRHGIERWPLPVPAFTLAGKTVALLVVDMQHFCAHPDFGLGVRLREHFPEAAEYYFARLRRIVPNIARLHRTFRETGRRVVFTTFGPELPDGGDCRGRGSDRPDVPTAGSTTSRAARPSTASSPSFSPRRGIS